MKRHLSYSEFYLYLRDEKEYYRRYIEGEKFEPTPEMTLGTIIHQALEDKTYDWISALREANMSRKRVIVRKLLDKMERKLPVEPEAKVMSKTKSGVALFSIFDGLDRKERYLDEFKTSANEYWNQKMVDGHLQLSFYAWVYWPNYHSYLKEIRLHFLNTKKGTVKTFKTVRSITDIKKIEDQVEGVIKELQDTGLWEKRKSRHDILNANQMKML